jgi:hypothetical protein
MPLELLTPGERGEITEVRHCGATAAGAREIVVGTMGASCNGCSCPDQHQEIDMKNR